MNSRHYVSQEMLNLLDNKDYRLTINIIGAGGSGSLVVVGLAKISLALNALGKSMPVVRVYDGDIISEANIGRMAETYSYDINRRKSDVLVERINRSYGFSWYSRGNYPQDVDSPANITISCVDTLKSRKDIIKHLKDNVSKHSHTWMRPFYMIDSGNGVDYGNVIVSTVQDIPQPVSKTYKTVKRLPNIFQLYKGLKDDKNEPSCSLRQAISKQSIMVNSFMADITCQVLWKILNDFYLDKTTFFINLNKMEMI